MIFNKLIFLILIFSSPAYAGKAVVIVLETALFQDRNPNSKVLQLVRKNHEVWIHDKEFGLSPLKPDYETLQRNTIRYSELNKISYGNKKEKRAGYLETMDRNGNRAFIKRSHVKLVYKDDREFQTNVNPFTEDPTDYRLQEPLSDDYPLSDPRKKRAFAQIIIGPASHSQYNYVDSIKSSQRQSRKGFAAGYSSKANWDHYNRFYFGGYFHLAVGETEHTFSAGTLDSAQEISYQISIGPYLSYDVFRKEKWKISTGGGINLNWNRHFVKASSARIGEEERVFEGINFSPRLFSNFHWNNFIVPGVDLVLGIDMQLNLAQTYKSSTAPSFTNLWADEESPDDSFQSPTAGVMTFLLGFQSNY